MINKLNAAFETFQKDLEKTQTKNDVLNLKANYLGKTGVISDALKSLKDATPEERKTVGALSNELKNKIEAHVEERIKNLEVAEINEN